VPFWTNIDNYRSLDTPLKISKHENVINIGCPGRLVADKNHSMVIEALHQLKQTKKQAVRLYVAGNGPYKNQLEQLVVDLGLEQEVVFLGLLNVEGMASFYQAMDV